MEKLEYYMEKASKYKLASGILRTRLSEMIQILADNNISNDEKVNILLAEMEILSTNNNLSYESLELDYDYSQFVAHSEEYTNHFESREKGSQK